MKSRSILLSSRLLIFVLAIAVLFQWMGYAWGLSPRLVRTAHPAVVGYFPQWGLYYSHPYFVKALIENGSAARLTQINYSQGAVHDGRCSLADANADLNFAYKSDQSVNGKADIGTLPFRGYFHQLKELKQRYPKMKILISLEGKASDFAIDAQPENRRAFVASCVDMFTRGNFAVGVHEPGLFDGFDIDWESPEQPDAANFRALLLEFRRQMNAVRPGLRLAIAVGQSPQMLPGTDFAEIAPLVDQVGVMNYDYAGPWSGRTGLLAPLSISPHASRDSSSEDQSSIVRSMASYQAAGVPPKKLLMGLPFYGYSWTGVNSANNGLFQQGRADHSDQPYHYIRALASAPFAAYRDERSQAPWLFDGETFWTYEDPVSVRYKVSYASDQHLGGVMIWELSGDTDDGELLTTVYRALRHPLKARVFSDAFADEIEPDSTPQPSVPSENGELPTSAPSK